jgi:Glycosyltransferase family 87
VALAATAAVNGFVTVHSWVWDISGNDFKLYYMAARIGTTFGWAHIYDRGLQASLWGQIQYQRPFNEYEGFLNPPLMAWTVLPLSGLRPTLAYSVWVIVLVASLALAWAIAVPGQWKWLLVAFALGTTELSLQLGQPLALAGLSFVLAGWLMRRSRYWLAGIVLTPVLVKPQIALLIPACLLLAGYWRTSLAFIASAGVMAAVSVLLIGLPGLRDYVYDLRNADGVDWNRYFTLATLFGTGSLLVVVRATIAIGALLAAWILRREQPELPLVIGLAGSLAAAEYLHDVDFMLLVVAAWLVVRLELPAWTTIAITLTLLVVEVTFQTRVMPAAAPLAAASWLVWLPIALKRPRIGALEWGLPRPARGTTQAT